MIPQPGDLPPLMIPRHGLQDQELTAAAKLALGAIYTIQAGSAAGLCLTPIPQMAELVGLSERAFRDCLRALVDRGHATPMKQPGSVTAWAVRNPGPLQNLPGGAAKFATPRARARVSVGNSVIRESPLSPTQNSPAVAAPHSGGIASHPAREAAAPPRSSFDPSWEPQAAMLEDLRRLRPGLDLLRMADDFRAYWRLRPGEKRANWHFEFRRWVLREKAWEGGAGESSPTHASAPAVPAVDPDTGLTPAEARNVAWYRRVEARQGAAAARSLVGPHLTPAAEAYLRQHPAEAVAG